MTYMKCKSLILIGLLSVVQSVYASQDHNKSCCVVRNGVYCTACCIACCYCCLILPDIIPDPKSNCRTYLKTHVPQVRSMDDSQQERVMDKEQTVTPWLHKVQIPREERLARKKNKQT